MREERNGRSVEEGEEGAFLKEGGGAQPRASIRPIGWHAQLGRILGQNAPPCPGKGPWNLRLCIWSDTIIKNSRCENIWICCMYIYKNIGLNQECLKVEKDCKEGKGHGVAALYQRWDADSTTD